MTNRFAVKQLYHSEADDRYFFIYCQVISISTHPGVKPGFVQPVRLLEPAFKN